MTYYLHFRWTVSRGRDTYGYTICTLYVNDTKAARCNGGGYDMKGTCLGSWIARRFAAELCKLTIPHTTRNGHPMQEYYGLSFHDPDYNPGAAVPNHAPVFGNESDQGKTIDQLEKEGKSLGLERYQEFYRASASVPSTRHRVPLIDGACGFSSVEAIVKALGYSLEYVPLKGHSSAFVMREGA